MSTPTPYGDLIIATREDLGLTDNAEVREYLREVERRVGEQITLDVLKATWERMQAFGAIHPPVVVEIRAAQGATEPFLARLGVERREGPATLLGMPLRVDPLLPPGTVELRDQDGRLIGRVTGCVPDGEAGGVGEGRL